MHTLLQQVDVPELQERDKQLDCHSERHFISVGCFSVTAPPTLREVGRCGAWWCGMDGVEGGTTSMTTKKCIPPFFCKEHTET